MRLIKLAEDFTPYPGGRYREHGSNTGEVFREDLLAPPLLRGESVLVDLDHVLGYGYSFLEEAFGGLVRHHALDYDILVDLLDLKGGMASEHLSIWRAIWEASIKRLGLEPEETTEDA